MKKIILLSLIIILAVIGGFYVNRKQTLMDNQSNNQDLKPKSGGYADPKWPQSITIKTGQSAEIPLDFGKISVTLQEINNLATTKVLVKVEQKEFGQDQAVVQEKTFTLNPKDPSSLGQVGDYVVKCEEIKSSTEAVITAYPKRMTEE